MDREHLIEGIVDRLDKLERIPDIVMKAGLAYAGYQAMNHWTGAITALVGLKLATGNNLAGGAAGVTTLTLIGLGNAFKSVKETGYKGIMPPLIDPAWIPQGGWV